MVEQKLVDLRTKCSECGAGMIRITDRQRQALQVAIEALRKAGFEVKLTRMYQAEPVMMAMMISKALPPKPSFAENAQDATQSPSAKDADGEGDKK